MFTNSRRPVSLGITAAALFGVALVGASGKAHADTVIRGGYALDIEAGISGRILTRDEVRFDRDGDGALCDSERQSLADHYWDNDDATFYRVNRRSRSSYRRYAPAPTVLSFRFASAARKFVRFDMNRDGVLSAREVRGTSTGQHMDQIDTNGDWLITPRELDRFYRRLGQRDTSTYRPGILSGADYRYEYRLATI